MTSTEPEEWRPVVGYEEDYEVSSLGAVRRVVRNMRPGYSGNGYPSVVLSRDGKTKTFLVHRLVAEAFIGPRPLGREIAHGDGDKANNRASNLRYATPIENAADKRLHGTHGAGMRAGGARIPPDVVNAVRESQGVSHRCLADQYGVSRAWVSYVRSGKRRGNPDYP